MSYASATGRSQPRRYRAYLLRLWQVDEGGRAALRASLEDPHTGEKQGFADLARLFDYLSEAQFDEHSSPRME